VAYKNAENLPPWPPVTFRMSGNTYYFPFRLYLKQERTLDEPMIRPEFAYVAENLLLRGGYRKTHFQADTITLYNVSTMGSVFTGKCESLDLNGDIFTPKIVFRRDKQNIPEKFYFHELILQSLLRKKLNEKIEEILNYFNLNNIPQDFEILGKKLFLKGLWIKHPQTSNIYLLVEVKTRKASTKDFQQLQNYMSEFGDECKGGILIAKDFPRRINIPNNIMAMKYSFENMDYY